MIRAGRFTHEEQRDSFEFLAQDASYIDTDLTVLRGLNEILRADHEQVPIGGIFGNPLLPLGRGVRSAIEDDLVPIVRGRVEDHLARLQFQYERLRGSHLPLVAIVATAWEGEAVKLLGEGGSVPMKAGVVHSSFDGFDLVTLSNGQLMCCVKSRNGARSYWSETTLKVFSSLPTRQQVSK